jgi:hypothetical protein
LSRSSGFLPCLQKLAHDSQIQERKIVITFKSNLFRIVSMIAFTLFSCYRVPAQSTIFNAPSTDIQSKGQLYVEADFQAHLSSFESGGYQLYGPRLVYGLSKRTEAGINTFFVNTSPAEPIEIQPNFKFRLYENESKGVAAAAGAIAFIPVTHRSDSSLRAMIYGVVSKNVKGTRPMRWR